MTIEEALSQLGIFQVERPELRQVFSDWLVDAMKDMRYERPRDSYTHRAYRDPSAVPTWAVGLPPEEPPDRA